MTDKITELFPEGQFSLLRLPEEFNGWKASTNDGELRAYGATIEEAVKNLHAKSLEPRKEIKQAKEIIV